jgi:hypothetical protein
MSRRNSAHRPMQKLSIPHIRFATTFLPLRKTNIPSEKLLIAVSRVGIECKFIKIYTFYVLYEISMS